MKQASPPRSNCTVLLVEDDERMRKLLYEYLQNGYYTPITARTVGDALSMLSRGLEPDVALVDLHLPNGSGLEVPRALVRASQGKKWPLVIMSGFYDSSYGEEALRIDPRVVTFIAKGRLTREELLAALRMSIIHAELQGKHAGDLTIARTAFRAAPTKPRKVNRLEPYVWAGLAGIGGTMVVWNTWNDGFHPRSIGAFFVALAAAGLGVWKERGRKG